MLRDYTYVDDIVSGIISAIDYTPKDCGEKFNLGFGNPVKNIDMIRHIEEHLGLQANIVSLFLNSLHWLKSHRVRSRWYGSALGS